MRMELQATADETPRQIDDAERALINRARTDAEAFAQLYQLNYPRIAGYIFRRTGCRAVTEDLVSEVFLSALKKLPRYKHRDLPFRAWLYRIATNMVNQWARSERRRLRREQRHARDVEARDEAQAGPHADDVRRSLLRLDPKHQAVLTLHYTEGIGIEQISLILNRPQGTIKSRLHRARDAFRVAMNGRTTHD
jgi:RNA polymerase sigma-70 factor (ECF subfamily)